MNGLPFEIPVYERMSCKQAAEYCGVSEKTLANWRYERRGPSYYNPKPGRPFYTRADLEDWLQKGRVKCWRV